MGQEITTTILPKGNDSLDKIIENAKSVKDLTEYLRLVKEVLIRFDTNPKLYTKQDFFKLILLVLRGFKYLDEKGGGTADIVTEWESTLSDEKVPSEKLVKDTIDLLGSRTIWVKQDGSDPVQIELNEDNQYIIPIGGEFVDAGWNCLNP